MAKWITVYTSATVNNGNILNGAEEIHGLLEADERAVKKYGQSFNWLMIQETASATGITIQLDDGSPTARTLALPAGGVITIEADEGEYYSTVTIINNSGAQYNANSAYINKAMKKLRNG